MFGFFYGILVCLCALPLSVLQCLRERRCSLRFIGQRFGLGLPKGPFAIWLHAASVGEARVAMLYAHALVARDPHIRLLCSTYTQSGGDVITSDARITHCYLPVDVPLLMRCVCARIAPQRVWVVETELWYGLLTACASCAIPVAVVNARMRFCTQKRYRVFAAPLRRIAQNMHISAQSRIDADRFRCVMPNARITVAGNVKFSARPCPAALKNGLAYKKRFPKDSCMVAIGSIHDDEYRMIAAACAAAGQHNAQLHFCFVPRHPHQAGALYRFLFETYGAVPLAQYDANTKTSFTYVDRFGLLESVYAAADIAVVCGSFLPHGGHNPIEAALYRIPILMGLYTENFTNVITAFRENDAVYECCDMEALTEQLIFLAANPDSRIARGTQAYAVWQAHSDVLTRTLSVLMTDNVQPRQIQKGEQNDDASN